MIDFNYLMLGNSDEAKKRNRVIVSFIRVLRLHGVCNEKIKDILIIISKDGKTRKKFMKIISEEFTKNITFKIKK